MAKLKNTTCTNVSANNSTIMPVGAIIKWTTNTPPTNWNICNGDAVSRNDNPILFSLIGTTYGSGDGFSTFNLPDMRDKFSIGVGGSLSLGDSGGSLNHTHEVNNHTHSVNHSHDMNNHVHAITSHTHPMEHSHSLNAHVHRYDLHRHFVGNHTHSVSFSATGDYTDAYYIFANVAIAKSDHTHSGTLGNSTNNSGWGTGTNTGGPNNDNTHIDYTTTGGTSGNTTGPNNNNMESNNVASGNPNVSTTTGANNSPYFILNYIVRMG